METLVRRFSCKGWPATGHRVSSHRCSWPAFDRTPGCERRAPEASACRGLGWLGDCETLARRSSRSSRREARDCTGWLLLAVRPTSTSRSIVSLSSSKSNRGSGHGGPSWWPVMRKAGYNQPNEAKGLVCRRLVLVGMWNCATRSHPHPPGGPVAAQRWVGPHRIQQDKVQDRVHSIARRPAG